MNKIPGRRNFLMGVFKSASSMLGSIAETVDVIGHGPGEISPDIMSDLTPELMAMEAERLGLDPQKDRNRVLESIQAAMGSPHP